MVLQPSGRGLLQGSERLRLKLEQCGLERRVIEAIVARHTLVRYSRGARIFSPGSPADVIFVVISGVVKIYCVERFAAPVLLTFAGAGEIIGYADVGEPQGGRSQVFEAQALTGATLGIITREHLLRVLGRLQPDALVELGEQINSLWSVALKRCARLLGMSLQARLNMVFEELTERFGVPEARGVLLPLELGQAELAAMIGGSRPMVSRLLAEMTRKGQVSRRGRQYVLLKRGADLRLARPGPARIGNAAQGAFAAARGRVVKAADGITEGAAGASLLPSSVSARA